MNLNDGMAETGFTSSLSNKAEEMLGQLEQQAQVTPPVETQTVETPSMEQTQTVTPPVEAPQETIIDPTLDGVKVKIVVDGQPKLVSPKDYTDLIQKNDVWTQRMQALGQQREQLTNEFAQREAQIIQAAQAVALAREELSRANPYQQMLQQMQQQQPNPQNPNEIATHGEMQQHLQNLSAQFQQALLAQQQQAEQTLNQRLQDERVQLQTSQNKAVFSGHIKSIMDSEDGQLLLAISPEAEGQIRFRTAQMQPKDVHEAQMFASQVAREWAENVKGRMGSVQKTQAVAKAKTVMEAPVGSPPAPGPQSHKPALNKDGSIDWTALRARAESMLE